MKAALVLFDWFSYGGLQRDCRRIGESLINKGADVTLICNNVLDVVPPGFKLVNPDLPVSSKVGQRKTFVSFLERHCQESDYDLVCGFNRVPGLDYYFAADTCFAWKATRERYWFYRFSSRSRQYLSFEKAVFGPQSKTEIFILSPMQKQEYLACYPDSESRMVDIPPGIARDRMAGEDAVEIRQQLRQEFALGDDDLLILQVGSGYPVKGVDRSLTAIAALPGKYRERVKFLLLGEDRRRRYKALAENLGIAGRVTILSGRDDIPRLLQGADLLLQPSRKESAGMAILEAIVAGLPVLVTESCGYAFHVTRAEAGNVVKDPFVQKNLNRALENMLEKIASQDAEHWKVNGIAYGRNGDFYDMPDKVADILLNSGRSNHAG